MPAEHCERARKLWEVKPYARKPGPKPKKLIIDAPKSSAQTLDTHKHKNLTLADWFEFYAYIDEHPGVTQEDIVDYFSNRRTRALLAARDELQIRADETPSSLSSKRPHVITNRAIELGLVLFQKSLEERNETVSGPMLIAKRAWLEDQLGIPENERLKSTGWVQPFLRNYKLKQIRRHGEAGSVDLEAVAIERARLVEILAGYDNNDIWNFDETGLYAFAPPDRSLASKQMSGKKQSKFRITLGFACNASGMERREPFFIGQSQMPRCFKKISPAKCGFYYRCNKKAWMTALLFEEWLKKFDIEMRAQGHKIILLVDNFSGHTMPFQPTNIQLEFFVPNMTSFVQPLDTGIIRCFKALYRQAFCLRAIDLDEAGERDIYKIDLLEAMLMAKEAWREVGQSTVVNCWKHTQIQKKLESTKDAMKGTSDNARMSDMINTVPALQNKVAWDILKEFAAGDTPLPVIEARLQTCLGSQYKHSDWKPAFDAVFNAEDDTITALAAIQRLSCDALGSTHIHLCTSDSSSRSSSNTSMQPTLTQLATTETELLTSVDELQKRRCIIGTAPTLEDLLNPIEEQEVGRSGCRFEGGDREIVEKVKRGMERGGVLSDDESDLESDVDLDADEDSDTDDEPRITLREGADLCAKLERLCLDHSRADDALELTHLVRRFHGFLVQEDFRTSKQVTLHDMWDSTQVKK